MAKSIYIARGYRNFTGEIEGKPYRTIKLSCTLIDENTVGDYAESYKLAKDCEFLNFSCLDDIKDREVVLYFNKSQYGITVGAIYARE